MTVDPRQAETPTVAALEQSLLDAKLSVPQLRRGSVSRGKLIETGRASDCRVVAVTAPAGYGKSTLLAEWARAEDRRVAWVSLDRFDDDPAVLLILLASAYARVWPGSTDLIADVSGLGVSALGRACCTDATNASARLDRKSTRLNSSHSVTSRMPSSA